MMRRIPFADPTPDPCPDPSPDLEPRIEPERQPEDFKPLELLPATAKAVFQWPADCAWPFVDADETARPK